MNTENTKAEAAYQTKFKELQALLSERESLKMEHIALTNAKFELQAEHDGLVLMQASVETKLMKTHLNLLKNVVKKRSMVEASLQANEVRLQILKDKISLVRDEMRKQEQVWWASCLTFTLKDLLTDEAYRRIMSEAKAKQEALLAELGF